MITTKTPGHRYKLPNFENQSSGQTIQFIEKKVVNGKFATIADGTTNEAVLEMLIDRFQFLDAKCPCPENTLVLGFLMGALETLNNRTSKRKAANIEGTPEAHPFDLAQGQTKAIVATAGQFSGAFTEWERRYREDPDQFMSEAHKLLKETPETYGDACAPYFIEILKSQN